MSDDAPVQAEAKVGDLRGVLPAGATLRGYELKSILGQGAFGITYRARDTNLHRDVAIKEYLPTSLALREGRTTVLPRSPDHAEQFAWGRERFLEEARTLARLDRTPAIVRVHDFLEDNGTAYMVMALIEGETLNKRLMREQRLTPEAIERLIFPLLDGLEEVHAIGFLHRDIKPANIMVDAHGRPTLIDFGAARSAMAGRSTTMTAIFTPGYAAVEQYTSAKLGPWTDIYGLSATVYHAITGRIPPSSIDRVLQDSYEPLSELKPEGYAPELLAGVDAGMARRVDERPQSIVEWRRVLRTGEHQLSAGEATHVEYKPRRLAGAAGRSRKPSIALRGPALWAAIAGMVLLLAGGGYFAFVANNSGSVSGAAQILTADQLEQALAERRQADALAAEKKRLVEEAQRKADADAETKIRADNELEQARQARQRAEQELAQVKADIEARRQADSGQRDQQTAERRVAEEAAQRKAEAEAAALRQAEEEAHKRAAAEAETKRQADEALAKAEAEKRRADEEARKMAEAEDAKRKADEEARQKADAEAKQKGDAAAMQKAAEANEKASRLEPVDRQRLQVALTSLGFDTRGSDGVFGPRSRETIAAWQKARNQPATGYLGAPEQQALLKEAAAAVGKFDEEQKKAEEDKKKAEDEARGRTAAPSSSPVASRAATSGSGVFDGTYQGGVGFGVGGAVRPVTIRVVDGAGSGGSVNPGCGPIDIQITVSPSGDVIGAWHGYQSTGCGKSDGVIRGRANSTQLEIEVHALDLRGYGRLTRDLSSAPTASSLFDGTYDGSMPTLYAGASREINVKVASGSGSGTIVHTANQTRASFVITISPTGKVTGNGQTIRFGGGPATTNADIQGDASKDGLALVIGDEHVWLPRSKN